MTKKVKSRDDKKRKAEIFIEIASVALLPRNDGILDGILNGILNEIASSFVSLTPRNDGDLMRLLPRFSKPSNDEF